MPATIFISVDLPAPFSPSSRCTSPGPNPEIAISQRGHAAVTFPDVLEFEHRLAASTTVYSKCRANRDVVCFGPDLALVLA